MNNEPRVPGFGPCSCCAGVRHQSLLASIVETEKWLAGLELSTSQAAVAEDEANRMAGGGWDIVEAQ